MTGSARTPRRGAARLLLMAVAVLVLANLLAPDAADGWAGTQPEGWRRDVAGALTSPLVRVARKLSLDQPLERVTEILDSGPAPVTFAPAVRDPTTTTSIQVPPTTGESGATGVSTTLSPADPNALPNDAEAPEATVTASVTTTTSVSAVAPTTEVADVFPAARMGSVDDPSVSAVAPTTEVADVFPAVRMGTAEDPLQILAVGDSLMLDLQRGMERTLGRRPDVVVEGRGYPGFAFTAFSHRDWEDDVLVDYARLIAEFRPDVVAMMVGGNEFGRGHFDGYVLDGEDLMPGSLRWAEVLAVRVDEAMSRWMADDAHVYWWTTPRMRDPQFLTDELNDVWASAIWARRSGASDLDSMEVLGDETGAYRDQMPDDEGRMVPLRKIYGVHFLEVGADLLARQLERRLVEDGWLEAVG